MGSGFPKDHADLARKGLRFSEVRVHNDLDLENSIRKLMSSSGDVALMQLTVPITASGP